MLQMRDSKVGMLTWASDEGPAIIDWEGEDAAWSFESNQQWDQEVEFVDERRG